MHRVTIDGTLTMLSALIDWRDDSADAMPCSRARTNGSGGRVPRHAVGSATQDAGPRFRVPASRCSGRPRSRCRCRRSRSRWTGRRRSTAGGRSGERCKGPPRPSGSPTPPRRPRRREPGRSRRRNHEHRRARARERRMRWRRQSRTLRASILTPGRRCSRRWSGRRGARRPSSRPSAARSPRRPISRKPSRGPARLCGGASWRFKDSVSGRCSRRWRLPGRDPWTGEEGPRCLRFTDRFLEFLGASWAPIGVGNDPTNLNRHWIPNVCRIYAELIAEGADGGVGGGTETA